MNPFYPQVARRAERRCEYCRAPQDVANFAFPVDHVVPSSAGGADDLANLALACPSCNTLKREFETGVDDATGQPERLFNPRTDRWDEHFRVDLDRGEIIGLTPVGRATVARLDMNHPQQIVARFCWVIQGLFP